MSRSFGLPPEIIAYLASVNPSEHPVQRKCREDTARLGWVARMQISPEQGAFMQMLARLTGARRYLEVGVFTGYSALTMGLVRKEMHGAEAHILACDVAEEWTAKGRLYWAEAGVADIIDLQIRSASETLDARIAGGEAETYDLAFIDADKTGYGGYYEQALALLRPGGAILFDNVLWSGAVADSGALDTETIALREVAAKAKDDPRVHAIMVAIGDGVMIVRKK
jgi:caffeoyl-CoA O-methyltransferase